MDGVGTHSGVGGKFGNHLGLGRHRDASCLHHHFVVIAGLTVALVLHLVHKLIRVRLNSLSILE